MAGGLLSGPYRLPNYHCTVRGVATNTAPAGPYRGVARPASVFAMESVLDSAARALGLSGAQIRRRNLIRPTDMPYRLPSPLVDDSGHYAACLDKAIELAGFDDQAHRNEQQRRITALDYLMPTSAEIPEVVIGHVTNPAAALASAVGDALGVAVDRLPITPSDLWQLMQQGVTQ